MPYPVRHEPEQMQFVATVDGETALLQYRLRDGIMRIVHTEVPEPVAGQGIAGDLMRAALDMARASGWRIEAACSYAKSFLSQHREYDDLVV
jgi:predicted GNAT family acetyltransferase